MRTIAILLAMAACAYGQLAGTVRDSVSKLPVPGAKITVTGPVGKFVEIVETGNTGEFRLEDVQAGKFSLRYAKKGYDNGQSTVDVKAGGDPVTLEIKPLAEVEGTVLDEEGKPVEGVFVYVGASFHMTEKDGRYDAKDIPGGRYDITLRLPYELRLKHAIRDQTRGETFSYANTMYYPGVTDRQLAETVTIPAGAHFTSFDIRLRRSRLVEMKGKVVGGEADTEVEIDSGVGRPDETFSKRKLDAHGGFRFDLLVPGDYTLVVRRNRPGDDLPYLTPVHMGQAGVQDLEVPLPNFAQIEGVIRTSRQDLHWTGSIRVTLARQGYRAEIRPGPEGKFALNAVPPGEWSLSVDPSMAFRENDPKGRLFVAGVRRGKLQVTESGNPPLEIVLSDEFGRIVGTTEDPNPVAASPREGMFEFSGMGLPKPDGSFTMELPPGDYRVLTMGSGDCSKSSQNVTVQAGATVNVHLKACINIPPAN